MIGEYFCLYLHNTRKACDRSCIQVEGYYKHWKAKIRVLCSVCSKPTNSSSGQCPLHTKDYYVIQYYNRLRDKAQYA